MRYVQPIMLVVYLLWLVAAQAGQNAGSGGSANEIVARRLVIRDSKGAERITLGVNESVSGRGDYATISILNSQENSLLLLSAAGDGRGAVAMLTGETSLLQVGANEAGSGVFANTMANGKAVVTASFMVKGNDAQETDLNSTGPGMGIHNNDDLAQRKNPGVGIRLRRDGSTRAVGF